MTQPAKVQEPSMEEILASIRRIIADDEAKPPAAEKPASPAAAAAKPAAAAPAAKAAGDERHSAVGDSRGASPPRSAAPAPRRRRPRRHLRPPRSNSQDDIDALLAGLDEATVPEEIRPPLPDGEVFELTDEMAVPEPTPPASLRSRRSNRRTISNSPRTRPAPRRLGSRPSSRRRFESRARRPSRSCRTRPYRRLNPPSTALANTVLSNNARTLEDLVKEMLRPMLKSWLDDNLPGLVERIVKAEIERVSRGGR